MAQRPLSDEELIDKYGPHLNEAPPGGWDAGIDPDRTVKTHCCFCGQQCGVLAARSALSKVRARGWMRPLPALFAG